MKVMKCSISLLKEMLRYIEMMLVQSNLTQVGAVFHLSSRSDIFWLQEMGGG